ncbi:lamin tail domain-containing protein [Paenimyroides viscosum]|uniref:T9SS C-terminal target domain-containing protein n=1 Tax=Paenimyroides viscosum TaxID=2488729 RepID=A0A3P1B6V3_9FLAO|nr:lamin tail domain-containing protein [Paenimyroides viscosum]RRA96724.1 T9SS C-terminal target domain-containing protein [Paenimyroides viscosum]
MKKIYTLVTILAASFAANAQVVISQVYGGGGNSGATYKSDFVELFNRGSVAVDITGYTLQYASAAGTFGGTATNPNKTNLPSVTIQPGQYYLIQQATGTGGTIDLDPDFTPTGTELLAMSGTNLKIVLASDAITVTSVTDANVIDFIGTGSANMYEGTAAVPVLSNTTAAFRNSDGCTDTNDNAADFTVAAPAPRNSQSPINICAASVKENNIEGLNIFPNPADDVLNITSNSTADKNVQLFDLTGKKVLDVTTVSTVNVSSLKAGIYVAKINEAGKTATRKVIIK